jgi:zinc transport system substrate-binding protein
MFNNVLSTKESVNKKQKLLLASIILIMIIIVSAVTFSSIRQNSEKLNVVTTFYPLTFLSQEIGGDYIQVTQIVPNNTEIHSWEPATSHIVAADDADIIIYNGAGLDHWMEDDVLPALSNTKTRTVVETTLDLDLLLGSEDESETEEHEHKLYDPHTWVNPYMAKLQAEKIFNTLVQKDPQHESYYTERWLDLKSRLEQVDNEYSTGLADAKKDAIFVSHEAFGYVAYRYGFEQYGVIGLSADEQPSAATIANLVNLMQEHEIFVVYVDPVYSSEYTQTIKSEIQAQTGHTITILELYLMLGPSDGKDFLTQMQLNLANLKTGLDA